jgi:DNA-binding transcriptional ArsR family regulator
MKSNTTLRKPSGDERLDRVFRALGDRTRRAMLSRLARGPAMVSELAEPFDMTLPGASKHLRVLEQAGLVIRRIDGRVHRCTLNPRRLADIQSWLSRYQHFWDETLDSLADHLRNNP